MGLCISGVSDVCGVFFGGYAGLSAGVADGFAASCARLSQQGFELGEDPLDRIEVGRSILFRSGEDFRSAIA